MLKAHVAKIKSAPNKRQAVIAVIAALLVFTLLMLLMNRPAVTVLQTGDQAYELEVATAPDEQAKGLGKRASLPLDRGMLFTFESSGVRCFWMKDMQFPLDIIWINDAHMVTHIERNVSPRTYPKAFCPPTAAQYVIELNAGQAARAQLYTGQQLNF